ncbi:MAG: TonB-dependent receptor [Burkholderiales bacterium]|nr:TonB-dependent receptor [Burkholderiales bacterium]
MKNGKKALAAAVARALGVAFAAAAAGQAGAQDAAQKVEKIEVTGSNIKRIEGESSLPVTVFTREDIERTGATTPMELLSLVSANNSLGNVSLANVIGATTFSAQTASLRGLGGGRTLVLVNGKRIDGFSGEVQGVQGVNLSVIPFAAIERVEVLKDGASAVYGSDAIGGVINFIMRSDYRGGEAMAYFGSPTRAGGGEQIRANGTAGFGDLSSDRYNVVVSVSYDKQKSLDQRDRAFSNTSYRPELGLVAISSNSFPGRITTGGIGVPGTPNNCSPTTYFADLEGCYYDPSSIAGVQMIPDNEKWNFFGSARYQIDGTTQAYATVLGSRDVNRFVIQAVPVSNLFFYGPDGDIPSTVTIGPSSPFYPTALADAAGVGGQVLNVRYRAVENGLRDSTDTNVNGQAVFGVKGVWRDFDWDASGFYSRGTTRNHLNGGFPLLSQLLPLLNGGTVNLFAPNTPEVVAQLQATNYVGDTFNGTSKSYGAQARASGEIAKLPAGPLAVGFGAELRRETLDQVPEPVLATGDLSGFGGNILPVHGSRDILAVFAEANVPLAKGLEAVVALRSDHYSDFGRTNNPKVSLRWEPHKSVLMRASYGQGFLAPSLYQLYTPNISSVTATGQTDPIRCPVTQDTGLDCSTQFPITFGGNAALQPETSENVSAGFVLEPVAGTSFSADYFKIRLNDAITNGIPYATILGDLDQYGYLVTRGAPDPAYPGLPGRITNIDQTYINLGAVHIEGVDVEFHTGTRRASWGRLRLDVSGTYYIRYDVQNLDGSYTGFVSNQYGAVITGVVPRWKHYAALTWDSGPWSATLGNTYQSSYVDVQTDGEGNLRRVSSMSLWDLQANYKGWRNLTLTLGVKNLLDTDPPQSNQGNSFQVGFDPSYYDPRARFVYGSLAYSFK